jgi:Na+-transporting NADH:ubiquinone oxidoreductase subunit NqrB
MTTTMAPTTPAETVFAVNYLAISRAFIVTGTVINRAAIISAYRAVIINYTVIIIVIIRSFNISYRCTKVNTYAYPYLGFGQLHTAG